MRSLLAAMVFVAACGVRTPARMDVDAMIGARGAVEARRELAARVLADPRDVQARLALAELAEKTGRPSEATDQLEAVVRLGGPLGTRWHDEDRVRFARLLHARARVRLARGAATALGELERARSFGAQVSADEIGRARVALAIAKLRHVDAKERGEGRALIAAAADVAGSLAAAPDAAGSPAAAPDAAGSPAAAPDAAGSPAAAPVAAGSPTTSSKPASGSAPVIAWRGAKAGATPVERGAFGVWLWRVGARREAYDHLVAWHAATRPPRDEALQAAYLRAVAWWSPIWLGETKPPPAEDLVGPERCWFPGTECVPPVADEPVRGPAPALAAEPHVAVAVRYAAARLDFADISAHAGNVRAGDVRAGDVRAGDVRAGDVRAGAVRAGDVRAGDVRAGDVRAGDVRAGDGHAQALDAQAIDARPIDAAAIDVQALLPVARAFYRDPAIAERLGRDVVASSHDAALGHATLGALFDALGDPARARAAWQAAVDASPEPMFLRGLAEAAARTGDGPAALVFATKAAAAWGDPAVVWTAVAETLVGAGQLVDALSAARNALELAGPEVLARALEVAIAASRAMGRTQQADALLVQRAQIAQLPPFAARAKTEEAEGRAALLAHREQATASTVARLWVASRALPRDVELRAALVDALDADDPRRATIVDELVALAGDRDLVRAYAAVRAVRAVR